MSDSDKLVKAVLLASEIQHNTQFGAHVYLCDADISFLVTVTKEEDSPRVIDGHVPYDQDADKQLDAIIGELEAMRELQSLRNRIPAFDEFLNGQAKVGEVV